jgi:rRNA maturation endonuclease Nob1
MSQYFHVYDCSNGHVILKDIMDDIEDFCPYCGEELKCKGVVDDSDGEGWTDLEFTMRPEQERCKECGHIVGPVKWKVSKIASRGTQKIRETEFWRLQRDA